MDRNWRAGAAVAPPPLDNADVGYPTNGNPGTDTPATSPGAHWYYAMTEEVRAAIAAAGITPDATDVTQMLAAVQAMFSGGSIVNGIVVVAENAVAHTWTISLKTLAGADASAAAPIFVAFRNGASANATRVMRKVTGVLSMVISSGSTLGHASGVGQQDVYVYLVDNAGTVEIAVAKASPSTSMFGGQRTINTTAEGGAGGADSGSVVYSTTARTNVPWVCIAKAVSNQTTAGTWDAAPTQIDMAPFTPFQAFERTFTATLTGVSGSVTSTATYSVIGGLCFCHINSLSGTSNSTACTITGFPPEIWPTTANQSGVHATYQNGGVNGVAGAYGMGTNGVMTLSPGPTGTAWTGSGNKIIDRQLFCWRIA